MIRTYNMMDGKWEDDHINTRTDPAQETIAINENGPPLPMLQLREVEAQTEKTLSLSELNALINSMED